MRPTILVLVVLAIFFVALALAPAANARPQGWYPGLGAGWTTLGSVNYALAALAVPQQRTLDFSLRSFVASASSVPELKLGTRALSRYIPEALGPPALSQPPQLNRRFERLFDFDSSKLDEIVNGFEGSAAFAAREAWAPCNRLAAIDAAIDLGS
jgi:hypothetical protein